MSDPSKKQVTCPHCSGTGVVMVPSDIAAIEAYYYGCWDDTGHDWHAPSTGPWIARREIVRRVGALIHPRVDTGFCPGAPVGDDRYSTRPEVQGEAALTHVGEWTLLSLWDRSIDSRTGSNSNFAARGVRDFATMIEIAKVQFPSIWNRFKFKVTLVQEPKS